MTAKQATVKKYVVKLSDEERGQLNTLVQKGKHRAGQLTKARILLKADASEAGEGWSDSEIAVSINTVARTASNWWRKGSSRCFPASIRPLRPDRVSSTEHPRQS